MNPITVCSCLVISQSKQVHTVTVHSDKLLHPLVLRVPPVKYLDTHHAVNEDLQGCDDTRIVCNSDITCDDSWSTMELAVARGDPNMSFSLWYLIPWETLRDTDSNFCPMTGGMEDQLAALTCSTLLPSSGL